MLLDLTRDRRGRWSARWREEKLGVVVAGDEHGPDPRHRATLGGVLTRWSEVKAEVARFAAALQPGDHVALDPPSLGGFDPSVCGFSGDLFFQAIAVDDPAAPDRVTVTFYTGYPDGYATYVATVVDGRAVGITAFAS
jgi:hypothetical protein